MFSARPRLAGTLLGLFVTVISTYAAFTNSFFKESELQLVDTRMQDFNILAPTSPIVHIDIDDGAVERVGRWPWHRDVTADVIRVLHELGAAYIMVDLLFSEPELPYVDPELLSDAGTDKVVGELSAQNLIEPDLEFARVIRDAGNVIMAVHLDMRAPGTPPSMSLRLRDVFDKQGDLTLANAMAALDLDDTPENRADVKRIIIRLRIRRELLKQFTLDENELAGLLDVPKTDIAEVIAGVKRVVANELVDGQFAADSEVRLDEVKHRILGAYSERQTFDTEDVVAAYSRAVALKQLKRSAIQLDGNRLPPFPGSTNIVPLYPAMADAALDISTVNFQSDIDGVVRRVPLFVESSLGYMKHMGLVAAARILKLDLTKAEADGPTILTIPRTDGEPPLRMPLDDAGNLLIHWTKTAAGWERGEDFPHISAARIYAIADARRQIRRNELSRRYKLAKLVEIDRGEITIIEGEGPNAREIRKPGDEEYRTMVRRYVELTADLRRAEALGPNSTSDIQRWKSEWDVLKDKIDNEENVAIENLTLTLSEVAPEEIDADEKMTLARRILRDDLPALTSANKSLEESLESLKRELEPFIRGKYAFVGFAATAQGDIVATPIDPQTNGVMCHAQVLNSILQYSFIRIPPQWYGVLVCLALGTLTGFVTATRAPSTSLIVAVLLLVSYLLVNLYLLFQVSNILFPAMPCVLAILSTWAFVTLFRQLTAERDKRQFRKQLSQYTSPAIAAKIAESPEAARAFKVVQTRDMSFLFSDLKGFTSISEREDAAVVQHVLNVYLERMSEVIWAHRGMINKFMGDGIMAIFNPSVDPLSEHPRAACEAALGAMEELDRLKQERIANGDTPVFSQLEMRVGMATGYCMNGDLGSELKADYTVIGDRVNLAARLEPANRVFGTSILISGPLYEAVREGYEFRYLAELQVKGKGRTVPVYEILGRKGAVDAAALEYARRFEAGVELYKQRKWDECIVHFTRILARRPDDAGASRYIDACQEMKSFPPGEEWGGALELKEK